MGREEIIPKVSHRTPVLQLKSEPLADADSFGEIERSSGFSPTGATTPELGRRDNEILITKRISTPPEELGVTGRSSGLEPGERVGKPQLIKVPRETEPPEVISIEMTSEEQDVYALMGISPLVRLNREIKNPKSVILSVVLPGESNQAEISNETVVDSSTETPIHAPTSDEAGISEMRRITLRAETPDSDLSLIHI